MCPPRYAGQKTILLSFLELASGGGGKKFVAVDSRRHAAAPVVRFHTEHSRVTANMHVAGKRDLLRQGQNKLNRSSCFHTRFDQKIKSAKTHVTGFALSLQDVVFLGKPHLQRQHHRKTACGAAFFSGVHQPSREPLRWLQTIIASRLAAMAFTREQSTPGERSRNFRAPHFRAKLHSPLSMFAGSRHLGVRRLVNCDAAQFILRSRCAGSKGRRLCQPNLASAPARIAAASATRRLRTSGFLARITILPKFDLPRCCG